MPTQDPDARLTLDTARRLAAEHAFSRTGQGPIAGRVGLEPEIFPFRAGSGAAKPDRVALGGPGGVLELVARLEQGAGLVREPGTPPRFALPGGGHLTFEPGAQIEHSTRPHDTAAAALEDVEATVRLLESVLRPAGVTLASLGVDPWHRAEEIPQQLDAPRYHCMASYFERRGPWGRVMMRNTTGLQVNLDLGDASRATLRYTLLNLASPFATATFATSGLEGHASLRARAWQELDPTRTGFPRSWIEGDGRSPGEQYAEFALDADVLLFRLQEDARIAEARVGEPGLRFRDWIENGQPGIGHPTALDLGYHLTTLFPEVRLRNFFELRSMDALPARWRAVPVVLCCGLTYDDRALEAARELLLPSRPRIVDLWRRSSRVGLRDPELAGTARELWEIALAGAARLPSGFLRPRDLARTRTFLERFTALGRAPGDELAEECGASPSCGLRWAGEAVPDEDAATVGCC